MAYRKTAEAQLKSLLYSVNSLKQLEEAWPEGEQFYRYLKDYVPEGAPGVPAVLISKINDMLGLPIEEEVEVEA